MIYEYLEECGAVGPDRAVNGETLRKYLELPPRRLNEQINRERREGKVICSRTDNGGGYYLPATVEDVRELVRQQEGRIRAHALTIRAARQWLKQYRKDHGGRQ